MCTSLKLNRIFETIKAKDVHQTKDPNKRPDKKITELLNELWNTANGPKSAVKEIICTGLIIVTKNEEINCIK
jgi:hypothetical protein